MNFSISSFTRKYKGQKLEVEFTISRGALKSMYRALYIASLHQAPPLLFPETESRPQHQPPLKYVLAVTYKMKYLICIASSVSCKIIRTAYFIFHF